PIHSGGIDWRPWRANSRISSKCCQAFLSRLSRSMRWALFSVTAVMDKIPLSPAPVLQILLQKQKARVTSSSGTRASELLARLRLSPETPMARDVRFATRSVRRAGTTHGLAEVRHEVSGYDATGSLSIAPCLKM